MEIGADARSSPPKIPAIRPTQMRATLAGMSEEQQTEQQEQKEAHERAAPSGTVVYNAIVQEGQDELKRKSSGLFWSGLAAGLSMGFSMVAEGLLRARLPDSHWRPLIAKLGYSVGFLIVVLGRQQLFTENTLTPTLPLLSKKSDVKFANVMRLWGVVFAANMVGALAMAFVLARTNALEPDIRAAFVALGHEGMQHGFGTILLRGIFAGWLIALMVWLLPFAETARVWVIVIITYLVGLGGFAHVIAGSVEMMALAAAGEKSWGAVVGGFIVPSLVGNIIGGVTLVAALNHAQIAAGEHADA
jgi:formate/nitrite transporter FocA (FNT family)